MQWSTIPKKSWWNLHWAGAPAPCSLCSAETLAPWFGWKWTQSFAWKSISLKSGKATDHHIWQKWRHQADHPPHNGLNNTTKRTAPWPRQAAIEAPPSESSAWRCRCLSSDILPIWRRAGDWLSLRNNIEVQPPFKRYKWTSQALISPGLNPSKTGKLTATKCSRRDV